MKRSNGRRAVLDFVRDRLEATGTSPTCREIGAAVGMSGPGAWKHVQKLIGERKLVALADGGVDLPERIDLSSTPTDRLRAELARRGVTMDALERPKLLWNEGRACAANGCDERVGRGMLMCRSHWFRLPPAFRSDIMNAWAARNMQAYGEAVEAARNELGGFTRVVDRVE